MIIDDQETYSDYADLFGLSTEYDGKNICPYCVNHFGELEDRVTSHICGCVMDVCDFLLENIVVEVDYKEDHALHEANGIVYDIYREPNPTNNNALKDNDYWHAILVRKCPRYKRIFIDYDEYINSEMWEQARQYALRRDGYKCVKCGSAKKIQVHHIVYKNIPYERPGDVITLCKECHEKIHEKDLERKRNGRH